MTQLEIANHLRDFILIIRSLFPHREVVNPFIEQIRVNRRWTEGQKQLLIELMRALTLLHQTYRDEDHWGRYYACTEDFTMATMLMLRDLELEKPDLLLMMPERRFYSKILHRYVDEPFTNYEARMLCGLSKTNTNWKLRELMSKGLAEHCGHRGQSYLYRLKIK